MEEQTGTKMVLEEQKETAETQDSTLGEQQNDAQEVSTDETEAQGNAPEDCADKTEAQEIEAGPVADHTAETTEEAEDIEAQIPEKPKNPNAKWYILQAYSGYEGRVEQTIQEKLKIEGLEHLVDEIFIPSEEVIRTKDGKKRKVNQKYFPGYVLVHMELTPALWHLLMDVNRVSGFIGGTQKNPLPLDERELEAIRSQVNERFQQKATEEEFSLGQKVTITEGSFGNFSGTIDEINLERRKLKVLVSIFGRPTPVEVEFEKVKHVLE
ncbi:MAG: transcription termination/antitermination protein NusG [SAR324 cluster bacterium]|nr:transcription termination/antitermination protein NusG [SAR324 cluster bacterium]